MPTDLQISPSHARPWRLLVLAGLTACVSGCSSLGVQPWERDQMAKRSMQLDTHPLITASADHIAFSKEGSTGGRTVSGGGCGCN